MIHRGVHGTKPVSKDTFATAITNLHTRAENLITTTLSRNSYFNTISKNNFTALNYIYLKYLVHTYKTVRHMLYNLGQTTQE